MCYVYGLADSVKGKTATYKTWVIPGHVIWPHFIKTKIKEIFSISFCLTNISIQRKIFHMDLMKYIASVGIDYDTGKRSNT
jgi:hypothetical protein